MKSILLIALLLTGLGVTARQINSTVSVSHYVNPELYFAADVACLVSDKAGKPAVGGAYIAVYNKGKNPFLLHYPALSKNWQVIPPNKSKVFFIDNSQKKILVNLKVRYVKTAAKNLNSKLNILTQANSVSEKASYDKIPTRKNAIADLLQLESPVLFAQEMPEITLADSKPIIVKKSLPRKNEIPSVKPTNCFYTESPVYYTFYYLKVNQEVFFSDVFGVPAYSTEEAGQQLLTQAWYCFVGALRNIYDEQEVFEMLHDPDNDLQLGLMHLRNPFIPSDVILKTYPYTAQKNMAEQELAEWITYEKEAYKGLKFIKVKFL